MLKGECVWVTHTWSTRVASGQDRVEVKSITDLALVKKDMDGAKTIRSEKLREHQYKEGYARSLDW